MSVKRKLTRIINCCQYNISKWLSIHLGTKDPDRTQNNAIILLYKLNDYAYQERRSTKWHIYRMKHHPGQFYDDEIPHRIFFLLCNFFDHHKVSYKIRKSVSSRFIILTIYNNRYFTDGDNDLVYWMLSDIHQI